VTLLKKKCNSLLCTFTYNTVCVVRLRRHRCSRLEPHHVMACRTERKFLTTRLSHIIVVFARIEMDAECSWARQHATWPGLHDDCCTDTCIEVLWDQKHAKPRGIRSETAGKRYYCMSRQPWRYMAVQVSKLERQVRSSLWGQIVYLELPGTSAKADERMLFFTCVILMS
jgi:hypothetical protein